MIKLHRSPWKPEKHQRNRSRQDSPQSASSGRAGWGQVGLGGCPLCPSSHSRMGAGDAHWLPTGLLQPVPTEGRRSGEPPPGQRALPVTRLASRQRPRLPWKLTSGAAAGTGAGQAAGLRRVARRVVAQRLAVTTETQAKNTQPFLTLGAVGLASRAMAAREPGRGWAPGEALCQSARLSACLP